MSNLKSFCLCLCFSVVSILSINVADAQTTQAKFSTYQLLWQSTPGLITDIAKNPNHNVIAIHYYDSSQDSSNVNIVNTITGRFEQVIQSPFGPRDSDVKDLAWNADGTELGVAFSNDIDLWQFKNNTISYLTSIHSDAINAQTQLAWGSSDPHLLTVAWGLDEFRDERELIAINSISGLFQTVVLMPGLTKLLWSPDGKAIAALMMYTEHDPKTELIPPSEIEILNPVTYQVMSRAIFDMTPSTEFFWRRDSSGLLGIEYAGSVEGSAVWQWDFQHPAAIRNFPINAVDTTTSDIRSSLIRLSTDGNYLALTDDINPVVYIMDAKTGNLVLTITGLVEPATALTWISDNELVISSDRLRAFRIF